MKPALGTFLAASTASTAATAAALSRAEIERLLPQKAAMCLIDAALEVTADGILCLATVQRHGHPLGEALGVPALHAVEYGAQAAALHRLTCDEARTVSGTVRGTVKGAARGTARETASGGLLLNVRKLRCFVDYLDQLPQPCQILARCTMATSELARYEFEFCAGDLLAARGELTLKLT